MNNQLSRENKSSDTLIQNQKNIQNNISLNPNIDLNNTIELNNESLFKQENKIDFQKLFNVEIGEDIGGIGKVASLFEKVLSPKILKKNADAIEYAYSKIKNIINEQTIPDNISLNIGGIEIKSISNSIDERALSSFISKEIKNQINIEAIMLESLEYINFDSITSEKGVDDDWFDTFRDSVKNVSSKELKSIWAKLLADEIESPSSYSLRTLNILKNMSKDEAKLFKKFIKLTVCGPEKDYRFTINKNEILAKYGIKFKDILLLEEMGLVQIGTTRYLMPENNFYILNDSEIINIINDSGEKKGINVIITSISGTELANIITELDNGVNKYFIEDFIKVVNKDNKFKVQFGENYKIEDNQVHWIIKKEL